MTTVVPATKFTPARIGITIGGIFLLIGVIFLILWLTGSLASWGSGNGSS